jgi:hypothetical protein
VSRYALRVVSEDGFMATYHVLSPFGQSWEKWKATIRRGLQKSAARPSEGFAEVKAVQKKARRGKKPA